jgi:shikimate kinase
MDSSIILIGPLSAGKSTVAALLAARLDMPHVSMDDLRFDYYAEIGYDEQVAQDKRDQEGWWGRYRYWKPFEAHAVERLLNDHPNAVIDLGAGHSVYEDEQLFERVAGILAPYQHIVLLLPDPDVAESLRILSSRDETAALLSEVNAHFLQHPSNQRLAKLVVYTGERAPQEVCAEIIRRISPAQAPIEGL